MGSSTPASATADRRWAVLRRAAGARLAPFGALVLAAAIVAALAAPVLAPHDPLRQDLGNTLARPGRTHLLGTDNVGRDVLSRVVWGTRVSLLAGFVSVAIALLAGGLLGLAAGRHTVTFKWPDGKTQQQTIEVKENKPSFVEGRKE